MCYWWILWLSLSSSSVNVFQPPSSETLLQFAMLVVSFFAGYLAIKYSNTIRFLRARFDPVAFRASSPRMKLAMTGSAVGTLIAQTLSNGYLWYVMRRINPFSILPYLKKILIASFVMFLATAGLLFLHAHVLVNILLSVAVYFAALKLLRDPLLTETLAILPFSKTSKEKP